MDADFLILAEFHAYDFPALLGKIEGLPEESRQLTYLHARPYTKPVLPLR